MFAAASLTGPFTELGRIYGRTRGVRVEFNFGPSSALAQQVSDGAPADVLATADQATMRRAADQLASPPVVFARNRMAIIVRRGNPEKVASVADLGRPGLIVVLCAPQVPCGNFAAQVLGKAGATVRPRSLEPDVKGVVSKVVLGEADAGLVYETDGRAAGDQVTVVPIPPQGNVVADYPIAAVRDSARPDVAKAFTEFVLSPAAGDVLRRSGFDLP